MTNIAEGFGRRSHADFARFLDIARASAREVQSLLYVAHDRHYMTDAEFTSLYQKATSMIMLTNKLIASLNHLPTTHTPKQNK